MKKTEELLKTIQSCKNYQDFISESRQELISVRKLGEAFQEILTQKKLKKSDVIRNSGIDRGYAYDILSDKKQPSRDKVLAGLEREFTMFWTNHRAYSDHMYYLWHYGYVLLCNILLFPQPKNGIFCKYIFLAD